MATRPSTSHDDAHRDHRHHLAVRAAIRRSAVDDGAYVSAANISDAHIKSSDAHIKSARLGVSLTLIVEQALGPWQALFFCELDGPRSRHVTVRSPEPRAPAVTEWLHVAV